MTAAVGATRDGSAVLGDFHLALSVIFQQVRSTLFQLPNRRPDQLASDQHFDISSLPGRIRANLPDDRSPRHLCAAILGGCDCLLAEMNRRPPDATTENVEELMENLTGAWLALYFLGVPFVHPWEAVAHHAERNGYYRGAGICKATGDVYRDARKSLRNKTHSGARDADVLLVLDHNPLAIKHLIKTDNLAPRVIIAALGACYELLQLRLYVREGGAIRHVVFDSTVARRLKGSANRSGAEPDAGAEVAIDEMWDLASQCYEIGEPARRDADEQRLTVIRPDKDIALMPACVLNASRGVFRSQLRMRDSGDEGASDVYHGSNGNRLADAQHALFRAVLLKRTPLETDFVVTSGTRAEFDMFCEALRDPWMLPGDGYRSNEGAHAPSGQKRPGAAAATPPSDTHPVSPA